MHKRHIIFLILALFLTSAQALGQSTPTLYVTSGANVLKLDLSANTSTTIFTNAGSNFEGLLFGPDNLLYVCDPANGTIRRMKQDGSTPTIFYQAVGSSLLKHPQCNGRFTHNGDFYVTSQNPTSGGSGVFVFYCVSPVLTLGGNATPPCTLNPTPTQVFTAAQVGSNTQGITQSKTGDALVVDQTGGNVWTAPINTTVFPPSFGPPSSSALITGLLSPVGIARRSTGPIFVVEHTTNNKGDLKLFVPATSTTSASLTTCVSSSTFGNQQPNFAGISAGDTAYVATAASSKGGVWSVTADLSTNPPTCTPTQLLTSVTLPPLTGIALSPTSTTRPTSGTLDLAASGSGNFNFGFSTFKISNVSSSAVCTASVTETQSLQGLPSPSPGGLTGIEALINNVTQVENPDGSTTPFTGNLKNGTSPVPQLVEAGLDTLYDVTRSSTCTAASTNGFRISIAGFTSSLSNPRIVGCDGTCTIRNTLGFYPIASFGDPEVDVGGNFSDFFLVNLPLVDLSTNKRGDFCGFQNPLTNAPPQAPATFGSGQNLSAKFKLAVATTPPGLNCPNGPYVNDAVALLSVARIADAGGNAVFDTCTSTSTVCPLFPSGSSETSPLFDLNPKNKQYNFSLSLKGYAPGTYTLNVLFLSNNAPNVTTQFVVQ